MKNKQPLTAQEKRTLTLITGRRENKIEMVRETFLNVVHIKSKEQKFTPPKEFIRKINREIERPLLGLLLCDLMKDNLTLKYVVDNYDRMFLLSDSKKDKKCEFDRTLDETLLPIKD